MHKKVRKGPVWLLYILNFLKSGPLAFSRHYAIFSKLLSYVYPNDKIAKLIKKALLSMKRQLHIRVEKQTNKLGKMLKLWSTKKEKKSRHHLVYSSSVLRNAL